MLALLDHQMHQVTEMIPGVTFKNILKREEKMTAGSTPQQHQEQGFPCHKGAEMRPVLPHLLCKQVQLQDRLYSQQHFHSPINSGALLKFGLQITSRYSHRGFEVVPGAEWEQLPQLWTHTEDQ